MPNDLRAAGDRLSLYAWMGGFLVLWIVLLADLIVALLR
jgi:hypothetical protein